MFTVFLRFAENRGRAAELMDDHRAWIRQGFEDGVFLLAGSLQPDQGGALLANGADRAALEARVAKDPFVIEGVVTPEIHEIEPARADARLAFLVD